MLKREATRTSLQAKATEAILNSKQLYDWARQKFQTITFFHYSQKDYERTSRSLKKRFSAAPAVKNISEGHAFLVSLDRKLTVFRYSNAPNPLSITQY